MEEQFKGTSKSHANTLILKLTTTKYDRINNIREHIMTLNDMARSFKGLNMKISDGFLIYFIKDKWTISKLIAMTVQ